MPTATLIGTGTAGTTAVPATARDGGKRLFMRRVRRWLVRAARLARRRSLLGDMLVRQLAFAGIVGAVALAALWWTSNWTIQNEMRRWGEQWLDNLDVLGAPLYTSNGRQRFARIERYMSRFSEISFVRYYSASGEPLHTELADGSDHGISPLDSETLSQIAQRPGPDQHYILDAPAGRTPIVRLGKPIWTRSLKADGLLGFNAETSEVDETLVGYVEIGLNFQNYRAQLLRTVGTAALIGLLALALLTAALWIIDARTLRPLVELQAPLRRLARGRTDLSVDAAGHRDIAVIADALNAAVSAVNEREEKLTRLANYDPLTGLMNRDRFLELLEEAIESSRPGRPGALLFVDLDQFKYINDTYGHAAGDQLLKLVAARLEASVRRVDTVARFGGDEFLILLPNVSRKQVRTICETIVSDMQDAQFTADGQSFDIRCSFGVAMLRGTRNGPAELLSYADMACHYAKSSGRNRFHFYRASSSEVSEMNADAIFAQQIQRSLKEDGFILHYQPIVDIRARKTAYHEVLLRMPGKSEKLVSPAAFLPGATRFGLMPEIDRWVMRAALRNLAEFRAAHGDVRFTLNVSGATFDDETFFGYVLDELSANSLPLDALVIEITEQTAVRDIARAGTRIAELAGRGCRFAIDDFGSGYCSYSYLKSLPVDFVKIDGSFIRNLAADPLDQKIVQAIGEVARMAKAKTIAEHVTDSKTFDLLQRLGVNYAQGYFLGKPTATIQPGAPSTLSRSAPARTRARARARPARRARTVA